MQKSHYPILLRLGTPIMVGQLGTIIMGFADTLMIGRHSTAELAAAGFANNLAGAIGTVVFLIPIAISWPRMFNRIKSKYQIGPAA